jgi:metallophosphoesterase (TIGR00282 family)
MNSFQQWFEPLRNLLITPSLLLRNAGTFPTTKPFSIPEPTASTCKFALPSLPLLSSCANFATDAAPQTRVMMSRYALAPLTFSAKVAARAPNDYLALVKLLFIADIVGQPGRKAVREMLPKLRRQHGLDLVIANGENAAGGSGITVKTAEEIFAAGVDIMTSGDHLWDQKEVSELLANERRFIRPSNYPPGTPGQGSVVLERPALSPIAVLNLQGRTFMPPLDNPFPCALAEVQRLRSQARIIFVDFHAEATSEKVALARMLDGKVSAVVGTHTHVQTADEQIFPGGTAYLSDGGFTGPHESVIGREIEPIIQRFMTNMPQRFEVAKRRILLQGAVIDIDDVTGNAISITRISEPLAEDFPSQS